MRETPRSVETLLLKLIDGSERECLLSVGGMKRIKSQFGGAQALDQMGMDVIGAVLYEAVLDKQGLTLEQFEDLLPANVPFLSACVNKLLGLSEPETRDRPTLAGAEQTPAAAA